MVRENDLIVGGTYTYADSEICTPIVITYTYLGKEPEDIEQGEPGAGYYFTEDIEQDEPGTRYCFRYLPASQSDPEQDDDEDADAYDWGDVFPNLLSGWGERVPTSFSKEKLEEFNAVDGLIEELIRVRDRLARREIT
jgi:hypothetical protein